MDNKDFIKSLQENGIEDRDGEPDEASIYGSDWDDILERVEKIINMR